MADNKPGEADEKKDEEKPYTPVEGLYIETSPGKSPFSPDYEGVDEYTASDFLPSESPTYSPGSPREYDPPSSNWPTDLPSPREGDPDLSYWSTDTPESIVTEDPNTPKWGDMVPDDSWMVEDEDFVDEEYILPDEDDDLKELIIYDKKINEGDLFLVIFQEEDEMIDKLLTVTNYVIESGNITFKDEDGNVTNLLVNSDNHILLKSSEYDFLIKDFEKIIEVDDIKEITDQLYYELEINPEIEIDMEETLEKKYSFQERKENFITVMISYFNAYNNDTQIKTICEIADNYVDMIKENKDISLKNLDILSFLKKTENKHKYPSWIIPIVDNIKLLYVEKDDYIEDYADIDKKVFLDELQKKHDIINGINTYQSFVKSFNNDSPYENPSKSVIIPYEGHYFRNCSSTNPCHGLRDPYIIDSNKTRGPLITPLTKYGETIYEILRSYENINIIGFNILPHKLVSRTLKLNDLNLFQISKLSESKYSKIPFSRSILNENIIPKIIGTDTFKNDIWSNNIHTFTLNETVKDENDLITSLKMNLPDYYDIIQSLSKIILNNIFNYKDIEEALLSYNIKYNEMDIESRKKINDLIKNNINNYSKSLSKKGKKITKKIPTKNKLLSTKDKIELSKDFIFSIMIIPIRNQYIDRFIKKFSREPLEEEDHRYLYEIDSSDKLLCKHHVFNIKSINDEDAFISMKNSFGDIETGGIISCKVCGEYLCPEDFSTLEGFGDGAPKNTRDVLEETGDFKILTEKQLDIKKKISKISSLLSIDLNEYDKQHIIDFFVMDKDELTNTRYSTTEAMKKHPKYKEIKDKYKKLMIYPEKTLQIKKDNKKYKTEFEKQKEIFKNYLYDCNDVIYILFLILFHLQTSYPPYPIKTKEYVSLWNQKELTNNESDFDYSNMQNKISMKTVDNMILLLQKGSNNKKDPFWKNVDMFLNENKRFTTLPNFRSQFLTIGNYILHNAELNKKLRDYINNKDDQGGKLFLKEYWSSYKPLPDTDIINNINEIINNQLLDKDIKNQLIKKGSEIYYENISSISPINNVLSISRSTYLKIPFSDIMNNESYKRLLEYSVHLDGISKEVPRINLLINRFMNTIDTTNIRSIISSLDLEKKTIDYSDFKRVFLEEIIDYFENLNPQDKNTLETYKYISINNWNGMLLNGHSKRVYDYKPPVIFPDKSFSELMELDEKKNKEEEDDNGIITKIFNKYCLNDDGSINSKSNNDVFIVNILVDPSIIDRAEFCQKKIDKTEDNFYRILEYKCKSTLLKKVIEDKNYENRFENRIFDFIDTNAYLKFTGDDTFNLFQELYNLKNVLDTDKENIKKEYRRVFNMVDEYKTEKINRIKDFYIRSNENDKLNGGQIKGFKKLWNTFDKLDSFIDNYLNNSNTIENNILNIIYIIGRLSHEMPSDFPGNTLHSDIPKQWKLSDVNTKEIKSFIENNEFLLHNDIFIDSKKYEGFYKYQKEKKTSIYFKGLFSYLKERYNGGIYNLKGSDKSYYTEIYSKMFIQFMFVYVFCTIIDYIESLYDEQSPTTREANDLFLALEQENNLLLSESINNCTELSFDILRNILDEYIDDNWINQSDLIANKISKQKEREKQNIINDLEGKTADDRAATVEQQRYGITNWFKDSSEDNLKAIKTDTYEDQLDNERKSRIQEMFYKNETMMEVAETMGIDVDRLVQHLPEDTDFQEKEEAYDQRPFDREDEGLDDADEDGDYRED